MLYFGMCFSMFCWHVEDHYMYSTSYLHAGAPKTWYGVSSRHAPTFDAAFHKAFTQGVENDPELFLKKASMVPPSTLLAAGVPVCRAVQRPGQFIVTLPQAYHAGFSHGFNTAEAVNFMLPDWLPYATASSLRYQMLGKEPVLDVDSILVSALKVPTPNRGFGLRPSLPTPTPRPSYPHPSPPARRPPQANHSVEVARHLAAALDDELRLRADVAALPRKGGEHTGRVPDDADLETRLMETFDRAYALGRGPPCQVCGHVCHFSFVQASARPIARPPHA